MTFCILEPSKQPSISKASRSNTAKNFIIKCSDKRKEVLKMADERKTEFTEAEKQELLEKIVLKLIRIH